MMAGRTRQYLPMSEVVLVSQLQYRNLKMVLITLEPGTHVMVDEDGVAVFGEERVVLERDMYQYIH
jgi:hypothetical protein